MTWMNHWDIEEAVERLATPATPNLTCAVKTLVRLVNWTDANSDGWPYWQKPSRAATRLMDLLENARKAQRQTYILTDVTAAEVRKAYSPIKAFLTRQGVDWTTIVEPV